MSTLQTQINLIHLQAGLSVPSVTQRTSIGSQFSSLAITVGTTDETVNLGDITTPKQVMVKLVSGDPVRVGLDGTTYPFRLVDSDEAMLLRLDVEGRVDTVQITCPADIAGSLSGEGFVIEDSNSETWFIGSGSTGGVDHVLNVGTLTNNTAIQVATAVYAMLSANTAFMALFSVSEPAGTSGFVIKSKETGSRIHAGVISNGGPAFTFNVSQSGTASPVIHLKSTGTSQVVTAVAPH